MPAKTAKTEKATNKGSLLDVSSFSLKEFCALADMSVTDRQKEINKKVTAKWTQAEVTKVVPMTFVEELYSLLIFLFGVPGSAYSIPIVLCIIGSLTSNFLKTFIIGAAVLGPLAFLPAPFYPKSLSTWFSFQILRYFSFKCIFAEKIEDNEPYILVNQHFFLSSID